MKAKANTTAADAAGGVSVPASDGRTTVSEKPLASLTASERSARIASMIQGAADEPGQEDAPETAAAEPEPTTPTEQAPPAEADESPADDQPPETPPAEESSVSEDAMEEDDAEAAIKNPKRAIDKLQKRIGKITAQKAEIQQQLEAERATLQEQVAELRQRLEAQPAEPFPAEQTLQDEIDLMQGEIEALEDLRAGTMDEASAEAFKARLAQHGVIRPDTGQFVYDKLREYRAACRKAIQQREVQLGQARERQKANTQLAASYEPIIATEFPWVKNRTSREYLAWQSLQRNFPAALQQPTGKLVLALVAQHLPALLEKHRQDSAKPAGTTAPMAAAAAVNGAGKAAVKPAPRVPGAPGVAPSTRTDSRVQLQQLKEKALKPGASPEDRQAWIKAQIPLRATG